MTATIDLARRGRRAVAALLLAAALGMALGGVSLEARQPPPAAQDEFVPMKEIPPEDQMPAAPLVIAAYIVAWLAVSGYVWSLWRRLDRVESELRALTARLATRGR